VFLVESLRYNLLSVSQLCNMGYNCIFTNVDVSVFRRSDGSLAFKGVLDGKLYLVDFSKENTDLDACLMAKTNMGWLWHHRLAHVGMKNLHKLLKGDHVLGLTDVCFEKDRPCVACQAGKQVGSTHHSKNVMTTSRPLELLHMDLFGPVAYLSIRGSKYGLVVVDDFSRFTWVFFLQDKSETQGTLKRFLRRAQNEFELKVKKIRSDNGSKFKNLQVEEYLEVEGIVGAKAKPPPSARSLRHSRWSDEDKTGRDTLRSMRHQTKACDEVLPPRGLVQFGGPRAIRPIVTDPAWPLCATGLICKGIPVITVCNPALWEYSGDNLGS
jgi:hypothetical protein